MSDLYIGLISGTSMDGIDAALVRFDDASHQILQTHEHAYPARLREDLATAQQDTALRDLAAIARLHQQVGEVFADAALALLGKAGIKPTDVAAIGSHGQTVRHEPNLDRPFSLQAGDGAVIAAATGITTIANFRGKDIELGGQGAPLAPAFHEWQFRTAGTSRVILNIGGIANVTLLPAGSAPATGFDTGPGNTLLDAWYRRHHGGPFDRDGAWAAAGKVNDELLQRLASDPYFSAAPPKSTGFEYFNLHWLEAHGIEALAPADVQATLCALTAKSIADAVAGTAADVLVCGGGVHNATLMRDLRAALPGTAVDSTATAGLDPDWVEAVAFAWLAMRTLHGLPGNLPSVTGASRAAVLGQTHRAS